MDKESYVKLADGAGGGATCEGDDCGAACNDDGTCDDDETSVSCPADCPAAGDACGDGVCDAGETPLACPRDCKLAGVCGDGACNGDEDADSCAEDCVVCGDDMCNGDENVDNCEADCPAVCGDGLCTADAGEDRANCAADCCDYAYSGEVGGLYRILPDLNNPGRPSDSYWGQLGNIANGDGNEVLQAVFRDGVSRFIGGSFDLGSGKNASLDDCEQCVRLLEDVTPDDQMLPTAVFFQTQGTLDVDTKPFLGNATLTLHDAAFHIVTGGDVDPQGSCYYIDDLVIKTEPTCGDNVCSVDEDCPADCPCGNGSCDLGDDVNCPGDCDLANTQGNFRCDGSEDKQNTPQDCCEVSIKADPLDGPMQLLSLGNENDAPDPISYGMQLPNLIGGPVREWLEIQFYGVNANGPVDNESVDLGSAINGDFADCPQCVLLLSDRMDPNGNMNWNAEFFQREGALYMNRAPASVGDPTSIRFDRVVLEEVEIAWSSVPSNSSRVPGGRCLFIDGVIFEHTP